MGYPQSMGPCAVLWGRVQPRRVRLGAGVAVGEVSSTNPEVGSWGCSTLILQLCLLPAYIGNADMIQPDLAPLQPSLDDTMEISGKSWPGCCPTSVQLCTPCTPTRS